MMLSTTTTTTMMMAIHYRKHTNVVATTGLVLFYLSYVVGSSRSNYYFVGFAAAFPTGRVVLPPRPPKASSSASAAQRLPPPPSSSTFGATVATDSRGVGAAFDLTTILAVASQAISSSSSSSLMGSPVTGWVPFASGACGGRLISLPGLFRSRSTTATSTTTANNRLWLLSDDRVVQVWLPPGYDDDDDDKKTDPRRYYPVLYVHDGQNAIVDNDSWTGASWCLVGAVTQLASQRRIEQMPIMVLLPSATGDIPLVPGLRRRHLEYGSLSSVVSTTTTSSFAHAHADWVATVVKPMIDDRFRTQSDAAHTFCIGTSMGGQACMNLLLKYPSLFGGAACLSPYFATDTIASVRDAVVGGGGGNDRGVAASQRIHHKRIYLDIGGDMDNVQVPLFDLHDHLTSSHWWNAGYFWLDTSLQKSVHAMHEALLLSSSSSWSTSSSATTKNNNNMIKTSNGNSSNDDHDDYNTVQFRHFPGARHNERAWSRRIHWPLLHLLGGPPPQQ